MHYSFDAHAQDFELQNAIFFAEMSALAYQDEAPIKAKLAAQFPDVAFIDIHPASGYDTELFVAANAQALVIAFRGTEAGSLEDWVSNLDNRAFPHIYGHVHQGFWESLEQVWLPLLEQVMRFEKPTQKVWFCGHSQGGALAMLAARRFLEIGKQVQGVYTYGQPKLGDMLFAANYDSLLRERTFRIYNEDDSVVKNPPKLYQAGIGVRLDKNGGFQLEYERLMLESGGDSLLSLLDSLFEYATDGLAAHRMQAYLQRLYKSF